jgi:hypothetical protein
MRSLIDHQKEALEYQEAMLSGLCKMASEHGQDMLSYLLGMAYIEVCEQLGRPLGAFGRAALAGGLPVRN